MHRFLALSAAVVAAFVFVSTAIARATHDAFSAGHRATPIRSQPGLALPNRPDDPRGNVGNVWLLYTALSGQPTSGGSFAGSIGTWTGSYADLDGYPMTMLHTLPDPDGTDPLCNAAVAAPDGTLLYALGPGRLEIKSSATDPEQYTWSWNIPAGTGGDLLAVTCSPEHALRFLWKPPYDDVAHYYSGAEVVCGSNPGPDHGCLPGQPFINVWTIASGIQDSANGPGYVTRQVPLCSASTNGEPCSGGTAGPHTHQ